MSHEANCSDETIIKIVNERTHAPREHGIDRSIVAVGGRNCQYDGAQGMEVTHVIYGSRKVSDETDVKTVNKRTHAPRERSIDRSIVAVDGRNCQYDSAQGIEVTHVIYQSRKVSDETNVKVVNERTYTPREHSIDQQHIDGRNCQ